MILRIIMAMFALGSKQRHKVYAIRKRTNNKKNGNNR